MKKLQIHILFFFSATLCFAQKNWVNLITPQHIHEIVEIDKQLYCASEGGLVVYDQLTQKVERYLVSDQIPSHRVEDIAQDAAGNIWIGTYDNGLARMTGDGWERLEIEQNITNQLKTYCLEFDNNDALWIGTSEGLFKYENNNWTQVTHSHIWDMAKDQQGIIYTAGYVPGILKDGVHAEYNSVFTCSNSRINCGQNGEIYWASDVGEVGIYDGTMWTIYRQDDIGLPDSAFGNPPTDITSTATGEIWVAFRGYGIYKFDGNNWTNIYVSDNAKTHVEFIETATGDFVISIDSKLYKYDSGLNELVDMSVGFNRNDIKMTKNQQGEILILSDGQVIKYDEQLNPTVLPILPELDDYRYLDFLTHPDGSIGFIDTSTGNTYYNGQEQVNIPSNFPSTWFQIYGYMVDSHGAYWLATTRGLIRNYQGNTTVYDASNSPFTEDNPLNPDIVSFRALTEDRNGDIWVSASNMVARWESATESWAEYHEGASHSDVSNFNFLFMDVDENNVLWGGNTQLVRFDGNTWTSYDLPDSDLVYDRINHLQAANGQIVLATQRGVSIFDGTDFTNYNRENSGLGSEHSKKIEIDGQDNIWITAYAFSLTGHGGITIYNNKGIALNQEIASSNISTALRLYPNPAKTFFQIDIEEIPQQIQVFDLTGRLVKSLSNSYIVHTDDIPSGLYAVFIQTDKRQYLGKISIID